MRRSLIISLALHAIALIVLMFGLPLFRRDTPAIAVVPVEFVTDVVGDPAQGEIAENQPPNPEATGDADAPPPPASSMSRQPPTPPTPSQRPQPPKMAQVPQAREAEPTPQAKPVPEPEPASPPPPPPPPPTPKVTPQAQQLPTPPTPTPPPPSPPPPPVQTPTPDAVRPPPPPPPVTQPPPPPPQVRPNPASGRPDAEPTPTTPPSPPVQAAENSQQIPSESRPRPGRRPAPPPPAAQQQAAATPTRPTTSSSSSQNQGDQIASVLDGQPNGRQSERQSNRPPRQSGQGGRQTRLSRGDEGAIRDKVRQCWNIDAAALKTAVVQIRVAQVQSDGTILPKDVSIADDGGDRAWANAARRAVTNPACQPWPMPGGGWPNDSFLLVFDPKEMF